MNSQILYSGSQINVVLYESGTKQLENDLGDERKSLIGSIFEQSIRNIGRMSSSKVLASLYAKEFNARILISCINRRTDLFLGLFFLLLLLHCSLCLHNWEKLHQTRLH